MYRVHSADNAGSHNNLEICTGHNLVMLSRSEASRDPTRQTLRFSQGDKRLATFKIWLMF
jgi:hypothetical protein